MDNPREKKDKMNTVPDPLVYRSRRKMWIAFLNYLVHEELFTAEQLLHVLEKPWKWEPEFDEYVETGTCSSLQ